MSRRAAKERGHLMIAHSPQSQAPDTTKRAPANSFQIERYGLTWSGSWTIENDNLVVTSNYGSRTSPIKAAQDLDLAAQAILGKIVVAWRRAIPPNIDRRHEAGR